MLLNYAEPTHSRSVPRAVFILAIVIGLGLFRSGRRRVFWPYVVGGLATATFLPAALGLDSPYLWLPFAEGLPALVLGCAVVFLVKLARLPFARATERTGQRWRAFRLTGRLTAMMISMGLALSMFAGVGGRVVAQEKENTPLPVLIPYDPGTFDLETSPEKSQVYVPYATFVELWNRAYPGDRIAIHAEDLPAELVLGNASYRLDTDEKTFRIRGKIDVRVFTREWTSVPLPVSGAELSSISVDGVPRGVSYRDGVPFVAIRGEGGHRIDVEIEGKVQLALGEASISGPIRLSTASSRVSFRISQNSAGICAEGRSARHRKPGR